MNKQLSALIDYFKSEKKIEFINNLIQSYSAGRAFNKVISMIGSEYFCELYNKGNSLGRCLFMCDYIDREEYNILDTFEKNGDTINGLNIILEKVRLNRFYFKEFFTSISLSSFYAIMFIIISFVTQLFLTGLTFSLIVKTIFFILIFIGYVLGVIYIFQTLFDSSFHLITKLSTLKSLISCGKGFEEIKETFKISGVKSISQLVSKFDEIDISTITAVKTAEISGSLDNALENRLKILKDKFKSKIKRFKVIISFFSYALIVFIIIINIFKSYYSYFSI